MKNWLTWKDPDAGKDWKQEEMGTTENEIVGWYHWLSGHEFEWTLWVGDGQGGLACCSPRSCTELDMTEFLNWTELDCILPGFSVLGILQARILVYVAISLLQGIFPIQGGNPGLLHCRLIHYQLSHWGHPGKLEPIPSPADLPHPRIQLGSFALQADSLFTTWANREALMME